MAGVLIQTDGSSFRIEEIERIPGHLPRAGDVRVSVDVAPHGFAGPTHPAAVPEEDRS